MVEADEHIRVHRSIHAEPEERAKILLAEIKKANDALARSFCETTSSSIDTSDTLDDLESTSGPSGPTSIDSWIEYLSKAFRL